MLERFGTTLLFVVFIVFLIAGLRMAVKIGDPITRKFSTSLADTLAGI